MLISDHVREAASRFYALAGILPPTDSDHRSLYTLMARGDETMLELLQAKLQGPARDRRLDADSAAMLATRTVANARKLPKTLPMQLRNHIFLVVHNALATGARLGWIEGASRHCHLCESSPETLAHLHVYCPMTRAAKSMILNSVQDRLHFLPLLEANSTDFLLQEEEPEPKLMVMKMTFSLAVWMCRQQVCWNNADRKSVPAKIADTFKDLYKDLTRPKKTRDRNKERAEFLTLWNSLNPNSIRGFTDGSSYGNPGPAWSWRTAAGPQGHGHSPLTTPWHSDQ